MSGDAQTSWLEPGDSTVSACAACTRPTDEHDLDEARVCLATITEAACRELERVCGGATVAALERELMARPSPSWRSPR